MTNTASLPQQRTAPLKGARPRWYVTAHVGPLYGGALWGSLAVIVAFLVISVPQWGQPYVIDEAVFPYVADGIVKNGAPFFYNGEFRPHDLGLWHPPLYDYLLAAQVRIWGMSPFAVRSFGAICVIASFFIATLALRRIAPNLKQYGYVVMAGLFLLNPLVISDALVPDIDGTLGLFVVTLSIWVSTVVAQEALSRRMILGLFGFATLAVSTKFTIAAIVAVIIGCSALIATRQRRRKLLWVFITFAAGTAVSLGLLFALGAILKFDAYAPFEYLFGSLGSRAPGRSGIMGIVATLIVGPGSNVVWIGPAIILSAVAALVVLLVVKPAAVSRSLAGLLVVSSLLIVVAYSYISGSPFGFPKYTAVVVPGLALATTLILTVLSSAITVKSTRTRTTTWILSIAYVVILVAGTAGIFAISHRIESTHSRSVGELLVLAIADFLCVAIATALFAVLLVSTDVRQGMRRLRVPAIIGLLAALVLTPAMIQTSSSVVNLTSPFSTRYYYGERGMSEFLSRAGKIIPRGASIISPKDVGLQLGRPYYEDASLLPLSPSRLRAQLTKLDAPYLVTRSLWDYSESVYPAQFEVLRDFYVPVLSPSATSDFTLWKHK
jgi:4-amino-4-deoxy-L-arabinose transferase-like glycosyltransferase